MVNNPYLWSTTAGDNSNVDGINEAEGMAPSAVNNSARQQMASIASFIKDLAGGVGAGGTANALTVTSNCTFSTLADGLIVAFKASANNTGAATLNVNAIGAKAIRKMDSTGDVALVANEIRDNGVYIVQYSVDANSAAGGWVLVNPSISATLFTLAAVMTAATTGAITLSGTSPVLTVTDTDTGADNLISMANSTGSILLSADHNNEVADSGITLAVDGSIIGNVAVDGMHLGKTSGALATPGHSIFNSGLFQSTRAGDIVGQFNRTGNDGTIVEWMQAGTAEGSVSISGTTTSYNTFFGSHWSQLHGGGKPEILRGTVVESISTLASWGGETNIHLPRFKISDTPGTNNVYGVFAWWDDEGDALIGALGAYLVRIIPGANVQIGDLLESNGDGCARVQADSIFRASTVAKVTSTKVAEVYADGSYLVPCTLHCG